MYKPLELKLELWFHSEDEDEVCAQITLIHNDCDEDGDPIEEIVDWTESNVEDAVNGALNELFNGGDLGDLFWPLQNE